jgi:deazaflavin-dependent oxidoreductase (nitroreductase family)
MVSRRPAAVATRALAVGKPGTPAAAYDTPSGLMSIRFASWMGCMQFPQRLARFNRHVTNPIQRLWAGWLPGQAIIEHVGRRSGKTYRTPVNAFTTTSVDGKPGVAVPLAYGPDRDWLKNVTAAGGGQMRRKGKTIGIADPHIVSKAQAAERVKAGLRPLVARLPWEQVVLFTQTSG